MFYSNFRFCKHYATALLRGQRMPALVATEIKNSTLRPSSNSSDGDFTPEIPEEFPHDSVTLDIVSHVALELYPRRVAFGPASCGNGLWQRRNELGS